MQASELGSIYKQAIEKQARHDYDGALVLYAQILSVCPNHPDVVFRLGSVAYEKGKYDEAIELLSRAVSLKPADATFQLMLAMAFKGAGEFEKSEDIFLRYVDSQDDRLAAHSSFNLIGQYLENDKPEKARPICDKARARFKNDLEFVLLGGHILLALKEYPDAIAMLDTLLVSDKMRKRALVAMAKAFRATRNFSGYLSRVGTEIERTRDADLCLLASEFCNGLGNLEEEIRQQWIALEKYADDPLLHSFQLKKLTASDRVTEQEIFDYAKLWDVKFGTPKDVPAFTTYPNTPREGRRLRLGIISKTFRRHVTLTILRPLLPELAKRFELFGYYDDDVCDDFTAEVRCHFAHWRLTNAMTEAEAAKCIHDDALDALIDISGHFNNARTRILTYRPAPVQIHYADSSCSLGVKAVQYRFSDAISEPPERTDPFSSEKVLRLPHGFFLYQPLYEIEPSAPCPSEKNGYVTFGSSASLHKITPTTLALWKSALEAVPDSRFVIARDEFSDDPGTGEYWTRQFVDAGIKKERFSIVTGTKTEFVKLRFYDRIDICLDTFPYSGVTTTLDALWMGVPMVTFRETRLINRMGSAFLTRVGLADLIAETKADFPRIASKLCADTERRLTLRKTLRDTMLHSPLCDAAGMATDMEKAIRGCIVERENR